MIFAAGNGRSVSWLDNVTAQDGDKKETIGVDAIGLDELKRLAQFAPKPMEADVDVTQADPAAVVETGAPAETAPVTDVTVTDEAGVAPGTESPVPAETPVSEEVPEAPEEGGDEMSVLQKVKELLDNDDLKGAKAAIAEALGGAPADKDIAADAEAEIPVTVGDDGNVTIDEPGEEVVSVEIEGDKEAGEAESKAEGEKESGDKEPEEGETKEHEAAESPAFEAGEHEGEKESKKGKNPFAKKDEGDEEKCSKTEMKSSAGTSSRFYKVAFLSPENKKKLADYWKNALGYDPQYVDMMTKDYEKRGKK